MTNIYSRQISNRDVPSVPLWKTSTQSLNNESPHEKRKEYERKRKEQKQQKSHLKKDAKTANIQEHEVLDLGELVNSSRSHSIPPVPVPATVAAKHVAKKENSVFVTETDDINTNSHNENDKELQRQKEDVLRKQQELELKLKQQDNELKRKDAAERARRQQQALKEEEKLKQQQLESETLKKRHEQEERSVAPAPTDQQTRDYELNELKERERKKREKDYLEEEERKKRWISQSTINSIDNGPDKNSVDKAKKEELLAKLSMFSSNDDNYSSKKNETYSVEEPSSNITRATSNKTSTGGTTTSGKSSYGSTNTNNEPTFNFATTNSNSNSNSALPPKPLQQQQQQQRNNSVEYKHSLEVENLHDGKPVSYTRDTNKNDLLSKLFGDTPVTAQASTNQKASQQSKMDKVDDIFGGGVSSAKNSSTSNKTPPVSSKVNLLPWELQDVNYNTNAIKREKSISNQNNASITTTTTATNKADHFDFFSKLNSKNETNGFKTNQSTFNTNTNGMNRPKFENKIVFPTNNHSNNYTEDIEELTL